MKTPVVVVAIVVLCIAVATMAQQTSRDHPKPQPPDKAMLVKLRADMEMLQLDHDADRAALLEMMKLGRDAEATKISLTHMYEIDGVGDKQKKTIESSKAAKRRILEAYGPLIESKKKEYYERAAKLNEKKIELEEAERLYFKGL